MVMIDRSIDRCSFPAFVQTHEVVIPHTVTKFSVEAAFLGRSCGRRRIGHTCDFMFYVHMRSERRFRWRRGLKAWVCGGSLAGVAGSNPACGMDVCLL